MVLSVIVLVSYSKFRLDFGPLHMWRYPGTVAPRNRSYRVVSRVDPVDMLAELWQLTVTPIWISSLALVPARLSLFYLSLLLNISCCNTNNSYQSRKLPLPWFCEWDFLRRSRTDSEWQARQMWALKDSFDRKSFSLRLAISLKIISRLKMR